MLASSQGYRNKIGFRGIGILFFVSIIISFVLMAGVCGYALRIANSSATLEVAAALAFSLGVLVIAFAARFFLLTFASQVGRLSCSLTTGSQGFSQASRRISESGAKLSHSTTEQAGVLQETVGTIGSMGALVMNTAANAKKSRDYSDTNKDVALKGKQAMENMLRSIDEISHGNNETMARIEASNQEIGDIVKMISEIESKAEVINTIVFQTKLLSFNASVEAARAGEAGKGFAVVAEEVGALARMSGAAAKDISDILQRSITRVEEIVERMQQQVLGLVQEGKKRVETGLVCARQCEDALNDIVASSQRVHAIMGEIDFATQEQMRGVREVEQKLVQLDEFTQRNALIAQLSADSSQELFSHSGSVNSHIRHLGHMVIGPSFEAEQLGDQLDLDSLDDLDWDDSGKRENIPESSLVTELKGDHQKLLGLLSEVLTVGFTEETRKKIGNAREFLVKHSQKEQERFYPVLREAAATHPKIKSLLQLFEKDMEAVGMAATAFIDRYSKPGATEIEFIKDCGKVLLVLRNRIRREETLLYLEYDKLVSQKNTVSNRQAA